MPSSCFCPAEMIPVVCSFYLGRLIKMWPHTFPGGRDFIQLSLFLWKSLPWLFSQLGECAKPRVFEKPAI